jgi:hypothetical protein
MAENPYESPTIPSDRPAVALPQPNPRADAVLAAAHLGVGSFAGFAIWAITAPREAWDINQFYSACVFGAGLLASLGRLRGIHWGLVGVYAGQVLGLSLLIPVGGGFVFPAVVSVLLFGMPPAVVGVVLGGVAGMAIRRISASANARQAR